MDIFQWWKISIEENLPKGWREEVKKYALNNYKKNIIVPTSITSREKSKDIRIPVKSIDGYTISNDLPWLSDLYVSDFLKIVRKHVDDSAIPAKNSLHGLAMNIQTGKEMRYECHIESNPITGLIYVTDHSKGSGGELVVSNDPKAIGTDQIQENCIRITPESGKLFIINASNHPHYVTELHNEDDLRIAIVMNYYNNDLTEDERPTDLDQHLGIS